MRIPEKLLYCHTILLILIMTSLTCGYGQSLPEGVKAFKNLEYVPGGHERQKLDLYVREGKSPYPLVIWIHGGAFRMGSKDSCPALWLTGEGYAVASLNYRLSQHAIFPAQIEDCKAAVRWLRAHAAEYRLDPEHFGAWGASAGGHLAAMLGVTGGVAEFEKGGNLDQSSRVQAVCDWFGPTDFTLMNKFPGDMDHDAPDSPESQLIGGPVQENKEKAQRANPISYVTADDPPFLIMHGDQDPLVPIHQSELLDAALRQAGAAVTFHAVQGAGHGFQEPKLDRMVLEFFDRHLKTIAGEGKK
ncbi:MAG: alpha/beta hydrolase fold domain-containing protein [bacterium]